MDARASSNPTAIRQWVTAVGFALQAEDTAQRATAIDLATALILADTAAEGGLALISSFVAEPRKGADFGVYVNRAVPRARIPAHVAAEINAVHRLRNGALHESAEVGSDDVRRVLVSARLILDVYVPRVLRSARALGPGSGVSDAVAHVAAAHGPIAWHLQAAGSSLRRRDHRASIEHTSAVLHLVRLYARPPLPSPPVVTVETTMHFDFSPPGESWHRAVEGWLVALALGLSPIAYARLIDEVPRATYIPGPDVQGGAFTFSDEGSPDRAAVSLETMSLIVLRLWLRDALATPADRRGSNAEWQMSDDEVLWRE